MMADEEHRLRCRVCGLRLLVPPWGEDGECPDYTICPCCGVEAGYEDCTPESARRFRAQWLSRGGAWDEPKLRPADWDLHEQLRHLPPGFEERWP